MQAAAGMKSIAEAGEGEGLQSRLFASAYTHTHTKEKAVRKREGRGMPWPGTHYGRQQHTYNTRQWHSLPSKETREGRTQQREGWVAGRLGRLGRGCFRHTMPTGLGGLTHCLPPPPSTPPPPPPPPPAVTFIVVTPCRAACRCHAARTKTLLMHTCHVMLLVCHYAATPYTTATECSHYSRACGTTCFLDTFFLFLLLHYLFCYRPPLFSDTDIDD